MKKNILILSCLALLVSLFGCGGDSSSNPIRFTKAYFAKYSSTGVLLSAPSANPSSISTFDGGVFSLSADADVNLSPKGTLYNGSDKETKGFIYVHFSWPGVDTGEYFVPYILAANSSCDFGSGGGTIQGSEIGMFSLPIYFYDLAGSARPTSIYDYLAFVNTHAPAATGILSFQIVP